MKYKRKTTRVYLYHGQFQEIDDSGRIIRRASESHVKNTGLISATTTFFYYIGLSVIYLVGSPFFIGRALLRGGYRDAKNTIVDLKHKWNMLPHITNWRSSMAVFLILLVGGWGIFHSIALIGEGQTLKGRVLGEADEGIFNLQAAGASLGEENSEAAQRHFQHALENFSHIQTDLNTNGIILNGILKVLPQRRDADRLAESAQLATEAGSAMATAYAQLKEVTFTAQGLHTSDTTGPTVRERLTTALQNFDTATSKISLATDKLKSVDPAILPSDKREIFVQVQSQLDTIQQTITTAKDLVSLISSIIIGQKNVLFVFQNNNELRPTGGFLGTFGEMNFNDGVIEQLHISSIYDLDGQLHEVINPPKPLYAVNDRWYMRDSNWFADFSVSAAAIANFYTKESGGKHADMVIGLTPTIVTDLLKITGPVSLPKYGVTLNDANFVELTQVQTSITYDKKLNQPKQFLADFFPLFLQKLSALKGPEAIAILGSFQKNLQTKEIQLYATDSQLQQKIESFNWAGRIKATDRDYLAITSANLGGTKTDLNLTQEATLVTHVSDDGSIINTLTLTRNNPLPRLDGFTNRSFVRFLVPYGSQLISASGFSVSPLPSNLISNGTTDPAVTTWESSLIQDLASGTYVGTESGKTFFGNWIQIEGGESKTVTINYKLPFALKNTDHYSLLLQKQSGALPFTLHYTIEHPHRTLYWGTTESRVSGNGTTAYTLSLDQDRFLGAIYNK